MLKKFSGGYFLTRDDFAYGIVKGKQFAMGTKFSTEIVKARFF